jgi:hypothetical protein
MAPVSERPRLRPTTIGVALALAMATGSSCADVPAAAPAAATRPSPDVVARFSVAEPLGHRWSDERVHFDVELPAEPGPLHLVDAAGAAVPFELEHVSPSRARVWTVLTLEPNATAALTLRRGAAAGLPPLVSVRREPGQLVLANERVEVAVPLLPPGVADVRSLPPPLRAVRRAGGPWIGAAAWTSAEAAPAVLEATTTVIAEGAVRVAVRQHLRFADGRSHDTVISLVARQDAALITEDADAVLPRTGWRLTLPGSVLWHNHFAAAEGAPSWQLIETPPPADHERPVCSLRPWSFWWAPRLCEWAGFRPPGTDTLVGVLTLRPSRWSPAQAEGFQRTELPIVTRPDGRAEIALTLGAAPDRPLHREWALSAVAPPPGDAPAARLAVLRAQLVKLAEFPLDEVKDFGFDAAVAQRPHPWLLYDAAAVARAQRQAKTSPVLAARVQKGVEYIARCNPLDPARHADGPLGSYRNYALHGLFETLPEMALAAGDPRYRRWLGAVAEGLAHRLVQLFIEAPERPALGAYGPWFTEEVTRLVLAWDLVADALPPEREAAVRRAMIFGAHVLAHPDYWNVARGLASGNPNMTSSIVLPRGLLGVALAGHPEAEGWLRDAEEELKRELQDWVTPGGAWLEAPGYQSVSLDAIFLLAQAIKNGTGRDYFAAPHLRETLDFYGFLLTAPDRRFAVPGADPPMVLPSVGQTFAGWITPFNGWMAQATAASDPAYAARQQFYWKRQAGMLGNGGRAKGFYPALTDADLPEAAPAETARAFPGFGSILRSSWTDPRQSYVAHRTGPNDQHYATGEHGSLVYYAKGAPLAVDWGNLYEPQVRGEAWYHNAVSFEAAPPESAMSGNLVGVRSLPGFVHTSYGVTRGAQGQESHRHLMLVQSADPMGASYLILRDRTVDGRPGQRFFWNLFCLAGAPALRPGEAHFPGQNGIDLDTFVLSPAAAPMSTDQWKWRQYIFTWGDFTEEQHGIRVMKEGSRQDFFTVLYPRGPGEAAPRVRALADGAAARVDHSEGLDVVLLSPDRPATVREGGAVLAGEQALARRYRSGALRLVVLAGAEARAELGGWGLASAGPAALEITGKSAAGVCEGAAREIAVTLPPGQGEVTVRVDGVDVRARRAGQTVTFPVAAGAHRLSLTPPLNSARRAAIIDP